MLLTLLSNGANVNQAMQNGATPLHVAVQEGHNDVLQTLLAAEADVSIKDTKWGDPSRSCHCCRQHECG